jgi:hypothetical protein
MCGAQERKVVRGESLVAAWARPDLGELARRVLHISIDMDMGTQSNQEPPVHRTGNRLGGKGSRHCRYLTNIAVAAGRFDENEAFEKMFEATSAHVVKQQGI